MVLIGGLFIFFGTIRVLRAYQEWLWTKRKDTVADKRALDWSGIHRGR
jgi:hypothetical protein